MALIQAEELIRILKRSRKGLEIATVEADTKGDLDRQTRLCDVDGTDFFTDALDRLLLEGVIDAAVHSAKDLPRIMKPGIKVAAITKGLDHRDALVAGGAVKNASIETLPEGSRIGISSTRRKEQILKANPGLICVDIRGTIGERLNLLNEGKIDSLVVAAAALKRLGMGKIISSYLPFDTPPLQGRLAVTVRADDEKLAELFGIIDDRKNWGKVYIDGAGPGDPKLITLRAYEHLLQADAVVYDSLAPRELLDKSPAVIKINAGKRSGAHAMEQDEINNTLAMLAQSGKNVFRMKGGDPMIFGRGAEEAEFLRENFVEYEITPGVTAATAAACYAEIPVTLRGASSSTILSTGYPFDKAYIPEKDYNGTAVYYMGAENAGSITGEFIKKGWERNTPAAAVTDASKITQKTMRTTIGSIADGMAVNAPAILIIGKALNAGAAKSWFDNKKKVLITGTNPDNYRHLGETVNIPLIELKPARNKRLYAILKKSDCVVFTSKHAVKFFFDILKARSMDARALGGKTIFSIGKVTTQAAAQYGIVPDIQPHFETADGLLEEFKRRRIKGRKILIPGSNLAHKELPNGLEALGNKVYSETIYKNAIPKDIEKIDLAPFDTVVFASPSGVTNFRKTQGKVPRGKTIHTIGHVTRKAVEDEKIQEV